MITTEQAQAARTEIESHQDHYPYAQTRQAVNQQLGYWAQRYETHGGDHNRVQAEGYRELATTVEVLGGWA